jgi:hypothetical protein
MKNTRYLIYQLDPITFRGVDMFPRKIKDKDFQTLSSRAELPKVHLMFGNPLFTVFFSRSIFQPLTSIRSTQRALG